MPKKGLFVILISAGIVLIAGVYVLSYQSGFQKGYKTGYDKGKEVGRAAAQTKPGEAVKNPLEEMPSTNPFEQVVNPFKELYKNPFK